MVGSIRPEGIGPEEKPQGSVDKLREMAEKRVGELTERLKGFLRSLAEEAKQKHPSPIPGKQRILPGQTRRTEETERPSHIPGRERILPGQTRRAEETERPTFIPGQTRRAEETERPTFIPGQTRRAEETERPTFIPGKPTPPGFEIDEVVRRISDYRGEMNETQAINREKYQNAIEIIDNCIAMCDKPALTPADIKNIEQQLNKLPPLK